MSKSPPTVPPAWVAQAARETLVRLVEEDDVRSWLPSGVILSVSAVTTERGLSLVVDHESPVINLRTWGYLYQARLESPDERTAVVNEIVRQFSDDVYYYSEEEEGCRHFYVLGGSHPDLDRGDEIRETRPPLEEWDRLLEERREGRDQATLERSFRKMQGVEIDDAAVRVFREHRAPGAYKVDLASPWVLEPAEAQRLAAEGFERKLRGKPYKEIVQAVNEEIQRALAAKKRLKVAHEKARDAERVLGRVSERTTFKNIERQFPFYLIPTVREEWREKERQPDPMLRVAAATLRLLAFTDAQIAKELQTQERHVMRYRVAVLGREKRGDKKPPPPSRH